MIAHRVAETETLDGLAAAMIVALVFVTPMAGWAAVPAFGDPVAILAGIGVGVSSSVIPYIADQIAMRQLTRAAYALMVSLLPATATVIGLIVLTQVPSLRDARRDRAGHRGGGAPSRAHTSARRTTVAAAAAISCTDAHSRGE